MSNLGNTIYGTYEDLVDPKAAGSYGMHPDNDAMHDLGATLIGSDLSSAEQAANLYNAQQSSLSWMRDMYADSTKFQRQVADLSAAGINPLMAGQLGTSSVQSHPASSAQPHGSTLNLGSVMSGVANLAMMAAQIKNIDADTALKNANANKTSAEEEGVHIDNEFKKKINDSKVEGQKLANELTRKQVAETDARIDNLEKDANLKAKQASTEEERQKYFETASILNRANAYKVYQLLPYQQTLMEAQTAAEKAAAGLAVVQAAYQQGLIDNGYIDNLCKKVAAEAGLAEDTKDIADIKAGIRTGNWSGDPVSKFIAKNVLTPLANVIDNFNPLTNALSGLVTK